MLRFAGDTFWVIAQQLGVEVSEIQQLNPGIEPTELEIGQVGAGGTFQQVGALAPAAGGRVLLQAVSLLQV